MRRLRSIVAVGSGGLDAAQEALGSAADAILLSVADARVPLDAARRNAAAVLGAAGQAEKAALVTVNHPKTRLLRDDLDALLSPLVRGVLLPHAVEAQDVRDMAVALREFELRRGIEPGDTAVFPVIDTARGLLHAEQIAMAAPRVGGLVLHAERLARDLGARPEQRGDRLAYARGKVVAVCRGLGIMPLVTSDGLELTYLAQCGFAGAVLPDVRYVVTANAAFAPAPLVKDRANAAVEAYEAARAEGAWAARFEDEVIDAEAARKLRHLIGE
ncbi:aldolase/citrate lyase family protein [Tepidiforma flava]|uniref:Aldolase/citrate lyase family protein n=1 Tax=Tepidiforma flava TaxID=3004094 RepID=A0ABY7M8R6_9CHLR|nr:aldolase/citrate lyase family protein [Tepidiforma flava]WBL36921.1 aldolase/citrate lyase family protein [Tepidiforma flava]